MFGNTSRRRRIAASYAETQKMTRDALLEHYRSTNVDVGVPSNNWLDMSSKFRGFKDFDLVQNTLCLYCAVFILELLHRSTLKENPTADVSAATEHTQARPDVRRISEIIDTAAKSCWICTHVIRNARKDDKDEIAASLVSLEAYDFSLDEFFVSAYGRERWHFYTANFRILPIEPPAVPHRAFELQDEQAESSWRPDGLSRAQTWIRTCDEEHEDCKRLLANTSRSYPSRLLDLTQAEQGFITLITSTAIPEGARYVSLSHCWGNVRQMVLLKSNIATYTTSIPIDRLPKTFCDAITTCVDLKIRFLWIDSLCIIQDDKDDWEAEAPRMAEIYTNAYVNLAATASRSDASGLFRPLDRCLVSPLIIKIVSEAGTVQHLKIESDENFETYVNNAPLNSRAWVLQERALSRRILHFANDQIYWQCPSKVDAQFELRMDLIEKMLPSPWHSIQQWSATPVTNRELEGNIPSDQRQELARGHPEEHPLLNKWEDIMQAYSACDLTFTSDKLIAVAGLASRMQQLTNWPSTDYLAGLWRHGLETRLLWQCFNPSKKPPNDTIPSWSWAHINSKVIWPPGIWTEKRNTEGNILLEIVAASTTSVNTTLGSVTNGFLCVRGSLCQMKLLRSVWEDFHPAGTVRVGNKKWLSLIFEANFDLATSRWDILGRKVFFLPVLTTLFISPDSAVTPGCRTRTFRGLMLEPTGRKNGQYRRLGTLVVNEESYDLVGIALSFNDTLDKKYSYVTETSTGGNIIEIT